jgi:hypothetical protein
VSTNDVRSPANNGADRARKASYLEREELGLMPRDGADGGGISSDIDDAEGQEAVDGAVSLGQQIDWFQQRSPVTTYIIPIIKLVYFLG